MTSPLDRGDGYTRKGELNMYDDFLARIIMEMTTVLFAMAGLEIASTNKLFDMENPATADDWKIA